VPSRRKLRLLKPLNARVLRSSMSMVFGGFLVSPIHTATLASFFWRSISYYLLLMHFDWDMQPLSNTAFASVA